MDSTLRPAGVPSSGVVPNFVDPPSLSPVYRGIIYSFVPVMFLFLIGRLYVRVHMNRGFGLDDVLCILGAGSIVTYCGLLIPLLDKPLGRHLWDVPITDINDRYLKYSTVILAIFMAGAMLVKLTLLALYFRLFQIYRRAYWMIWGGAAAVSGFYLISMTLILVKCVPRGDQTWLMAAYVGDCTPTQNKLSKASGIFGLLSDLYILAVPIWPVSKLRSPSKRKIGVIAVFMTGVVACAFSAAGTAARFQWKQSDGTYSMLYVFGILELNIGNICACMPTLVPLLKQGAATASSFWQTISQYYSSLLTSNRHEKSQDTSQKPVSNDEAYEGLPKIPRGIFTGLRTFIHKNNRTSAEDTELHSRSDGTVLLTQNSEFDSYHNNIKNVFSYDLERNTTSRFVEAKTSPTSSDGDSQNTRANMKCKRGS